GQTQTKTFGSEEECLKEAKKLLSEKLKKGYVEEIGDLATTKSAATNTEKKNSEPKADHLKEWQELAQAKGKHQALIRYFSHLADTPGFQPVLEAVMKEALEISCTKEALLVSFPGKEVLTVLAPAKKISSKYPESFQKLLAKHSLISLENAMLALGDHGNFDEDWHEFMEEGSVLTGIVKPENIVSPLWDYSDCWLYHPKEKNTFGEPVIYYVSHDGGDIDDAQPYNAGALFLKRCAEIMELDVEIPPILLEANENDGHYESWWNSLEKSWKAVLAERYQITKATQAKKVAAITELYIDGKSSVTTLEPVRIMERLTDLNCEATNVTDLSPLSVLQQLTNVRLCSPKITDFSPLNSLQKIKDLNLAKTQLSDLRNFSKLTSLERLDISHTRVADLNPIKGLPKLRELSITNTPITAFEILTSLENLRTLKTAETSLPSLEPIVGCKKIYALDCRKTAVSFEELLRFKSERTMDDPLRRIDINSDYTDRTEAFIEAIEKIDFSITGLENSILNWSIAQLSAVIKDEDKILISRLIKSCIKLPLSNASANLLEKFSSEILVPAVRNGLDAETLQEVVSSLIPKQITNAHLAFNLACYHAKQNDKPKLLEYAALALQKGYDRTRFQIDKVFAAFLKDDEFKNLIINPAETNPETDPMGWWRSLPKDLRNVLEHKIDVLSPEGIKQLINRKDLDVWYDRAQSLDALRALKGLKKLTLRDCKAYTLDALSTLANLEEFECKWEGYGSTGKGRYSDIMPLAGLTRLRKLDLTGHKIEDSTPLKNLVQLESLNLWGSCVKSPEVLKNLVQLKDLTVGFKGDVELDTSFLSGLRKLSSLDLLAENSAPLIVVSLEGLRGLTAIKKLWIKNLRSVSGEKVSLDPLASLTNLEYLALGETPYESLEPLYQLKSLITIYISKLTNDLKKELKDRMPWCKVHE
uniref:leucine-rich repeat domain-containing protein n=1 Tax=Leptospira alstonii TaxID=28452 RepID=UPI000774B34A